MKTSILSLRGLSLTALGAALAVGAAAQTVPDQSLPQSNLNIPTNLQVYGKRDPNVRKATAIVNDAVITGTDVDHRMNLIIAANQLKLSPQELEALRVQVTSQLIDETLQIQEAKAADINVSAQEIDNGFTRIAGSFNRPLSEMRSYLRSIGSSDRTLRRQIEAQIAWRRYLQRRVTFNVNIPDAEVKSILARLAAQKGSEEVHVKEIYLRAAPGQETQIINEARTLMDEIKAGKRSFEQIAFERSDATTRPVGGDLGWVKPGTLPDTLAQAAVEMNPQQLAGPIEVPGGFSLLYVVEKRKLLMANPDDAVLSLRQLSVAFPAGTTKEQATAKVAQFAEATKALKGCGDAKKVADGLGAEVVDNDSIKLKDLPGPLKNMISSMQVGETTPPFGSPEDGVRVLVLCGRNDPVAGQLPTAEQIRNQMEDQAINLRADHKLRDLRRDAVIEYR
ncbi:MAG: peptidylprolyl isomerase [Sphingomonas sp.]|uniref:peptidylprolyl isomerase n=1 Tax=Sphingomonas sp. TaxID=28214 RepID=UPI0025D976ED|nr:peptidylprolyl isomerase [Sphingomonas sp.]MBX9880492.1 peptidylprolyl isomerase [Sphingomonas sp.]